MIGMRNRLLSPSYFSQLRQTPYSTFTSFWLTQLEKDHPLSDKAAKMAEWLKCLKVPQWSRTHCRPMKPAHPSIHTPTSLFLPEYPIAIPTPLYSDSTKHQNLYLLSFLQVFLSHGVHSMNARRISRRGEVTERRHTADSKALGSPMSHLLLQVNFWGICLPTFCLPPGLLLVGDKDPCSVAYKSSSSLLRNYRSVLKCRRKSEGEWKANNCFDSVYVLGEKTSRERLFCKIMEVPSSGIKVCHSAHLFEVHFSFLCICTQLWWPWVPPCLDPSLFSTME